MAYVNSVNKDNFFGYPIMEEEMIEHKDIAVEIKKISPVRVTKNNKRIMDLTVTELSTSESLDVACFVSSDPFPFKINDQVIMKVSISEYKGQPQYSTGASRLSYMGTKASSLPDEPAKSLPQASNKQVDPSVWEAKDKRMCIMNALSHAVEIVKMSSATIDLNENEVRNLVEMQAEQLVEFIYERKADKLMIDNEETEA